jgi:recombination protein RecA
MATKKKESAKALALAPTAADRKKLIEDIVKTSSKAFGDGALGTARGKHAISVEVPEVIDTGSIGLNNALGVGGYPTGRVVEIYGPESSGKTTLALHAIANAQSMGKVAGFVDAEHALDVEYAEALGVNLEELLLHQPDNGEQALQMVDSLVKAGVSIVVVDSVAALVPQSELEGDMGDHHPGAQARLMSQALRKLTGIVKRTGTLLIFINQIRHKIGVRFGSPKTTSGGNALKFYASIRLEIVRIGSVKKGDEIDGNKTRVKVVKNKVAPPFKTTEFDIVFGEGVSWAGELIDYATATDVLKKSGAWYSFGDDRLGMGRKNVIERLKDEPELAKAIRAKLP